MTNTPKGPLQGVRVIDLTTVMLGPFCTQILGEMGAEIIKIETPEGDVNRWTGESRSPGMSTGQLIKGRNKRSIILDLKVKKVRKVFEKLIQTADVFVHNIRPKAAKRFDTGRFGDSKPIWKSHGDTSIRSKRHG